MKRKILLIVLFILVIFYLQFGRPAKINHSTTSSNAQGYELNLSVTMNKLVIFDRDKSANTLIQQITENDFKNMQFSYDELGYPSALTVTAYTNNLTKYLNLPAYVFWYRQDIPYLYNIVDNPERFKVVYK